jgi:hypothetical protein
MLNTLKVYEEISGQAINMQKSEIYYSKNTTGDMKEKIQSILQVTESMGSGKYLGLPSMVGRKKRQFLIISKTVFGSAFRVGRVNTYPRQEERYLSNLLHNLFQHIV